MRFERKEVRFERKEVRFEREPEIRAGRGLSHLSYVLPLCAICAALCYAM